jgi:hypothetical protein
LGLVSGNYDPTAKALDFGKGLSQPLADLFGIPSKVPTDVTNKATMENARNKIRSGQFDRGRIQARLAKGGAITRNVGYIDSDVLNDPANKKLVEEQIAKLQEQGIKITDGYRGYKKYLADLAAQQRKSGDLSKLTSIVGLPGAGKKYPNVREPTI